MGCGGSCAGSCGGEVPAEVVTALVVADEAEARAVAEEAAPARRWPTLDAGGLDQVKLALVWALLAGQPFRDELVLAFTPLDEVSEDGPWVFRVPGELVGLLAGLEPGGVGAVAAAWADTDELALDGREPDDVRALLDRLRGAARAAGAARKPLLMRVSL